MDPEMNENMRKVSAIMLLSANYDSIMPDDLLKTWIDLLAEYSAYAVEVGVKDVIQTYEYKTRPPFAVLRKSIDKTSGIRRIDPEEAIKIEAEAEWDGLLDDIADYGRYNKPELHPTTTYVLRGMGGWEAACDWETSRLEWRHKEFVEKWMMAYGREDAMALGAYGVQELAQGPKSAADILGLLHGKKEIAQ